MNSEFKETVSGDEFPGYNNVGQTDSRQPLYSTWIEGRLCVFWLQPRAVERLD
jgi:hypothetical protein